tara:strand:- start:426 stop:1727 length:1302 start_codon:yes stop_codon:yes gene_type:complete
MGIKVLSLFDGMSCTQLALQQCGIEVDTYYASEIDKYAIQVTQENFPNTIQIGDVCNVDPKDYKDIDLITCGSPCQGFSFAGKQLAFDDPRSALFFEFIRILKEIKPKYFLLENVRMKQQFQDVITDQVSACYPDFQGEDLFEGKIKPILINSALLSAQNRLRLYWTNIPNVEQPEDQGIVLKDILVKEEEWQEEVPQYLQNHFHGEPRANQVRHIDVGKSKTLTATMYKGQIQSWIKKDVEISDKLNDRLTNNPRSRAFQPNQEKSGALLANQHKQSTDSLFALKEPKQVGVAVDINGHDILKRVYSPEGKSPTLNTMQGGNREPKVLSGAWRARSYDDEGQRVKWKETKPKQMLELRKDEKSNALSSVEKDNVAVSEEKLSWRKLLPIECERLQTVPDNYTNCVSKTQRFKMLGNGFTVSVISHILKNMEL